MSSDVSWKTTTNHSIITYIIYIVLEVQSVTYKYLKDFGESILNDNKLKDNYNYIKYMIFYIIIILNIKIIYFFNNLLQLENAIKDDFNLISKRSILMFNSSEYEQNNYSKIKKVIY